jgi:hypothetical protein
MPPLIEEEDPRCHRCHGSKVIVVEGRTVVDRGGGPTAVEEEDPRCRKSRRRTRAAGRRANHRRPISTHRSPPSTASSRPQPWRPEERSTLCHRHPSIRLGDIDTPSPRRERRRVRQHGRLGPPQRAASLRDGVQWRQCLAGWNERKPRQGMPRPVQF